MSATEVSLEDRQAIRDALMRYVWSMDTGDVEGVVAAFVPDGEVRDVTGRRWGRDAGGVRAFATHFLGRPDRPPGQHHVQEMRVERTGAAACRVVSYWSLLAWAAGRDAPSVRLLGCYHDACVRAGERWLIAEKIIDPWNEATLARLRAGT